MQPLSFSEYLPACGIEDKYDAFLASSRARTFLAMIASMIGVLVYSMDFFLMKFTFLLITGAIISKKVK